jgi:hypothetical protein
VAPLRPRSTADTGCSVCLDVTRMTFGKYVLLETFRYYIYIIIIIMIIMTIIKIVIYIYDYIYIII